MRKTVITILLGFVATASSFAQTAYSARILSENDYEGTARTAAMGNAFTALGGDLGSVALNPAGSAVSNYSQISVTPGISIVGSTVSGVSPYDNGELPYFERTMKNSLTRFNFPNAGLSVNFNTGRISGVKNVAVAFVVNKTASYDQNVYGAGTNTTTSFAGQIAEDATFNSYPSSALGADNAYDLLPWKAVVGYQSGMIDPIGSGFIGATEKTMGGKNFLAGKINQEYGRNIRGGKYEYLINLGMNISDFIYLGANLSIYSTSYSYSEYFRERAVNESDFKIEYVDESDNVVATKYFSELKYKSNYSYYGLGCSAKFGIIAVPVEGLRIGAAIQTPTIMEVEEAWEEAAETEFTGPDGGSNSAVSPYGENKWTFRSPLRANFGVAYTIGQMALVSVDYEFSDYGNLKYRGSSYTDRSVLDEINDEIRNSYGFGHSLRAGIEFKPIAPLAIRAGYNLNVDPEKSIWDGFEYIGLEPLYTHKVGFGLGFSTNGSFFADIACTRNFIPVEYFMPYSDYVYITDSEGNSVIDQNYFAPEILIKPSLWKVMLTLGFRF